jgi:hypothetical protein
MVLRCRGGTDIILQTYFIWSNLFLESGYAQDHRLLLLLLFALDSHKQSET